MRKRIYTALKNKYKDKGEISKYRKEYVSLYDAFKKNNKSDKNITQEVIDMCLKLEIPLSSYIIKIIERYLLQGHLFNNMEIYQQIPDDYQQIVKLLNPDYPIKISNACMHIFTINKTIYDIAMQSYDIPLVYKYATSSWFIELVRDKTNAEFTYNDLYNYILYNHVEVLKYVIFEGYIDKCQTDEVIQLLGIASAEAGLLLKRTIDARYFFYATVVSDRADILSKIKLPESFDKYESGWWIRQAIDSYSAMEYLASMPEYACDSGLRYLVIKYGSAPIVELFLGNEQLLSEEIGVALYRSNDVSNLKNNTGKALYRGNNVTNLIIDQAIEEGFDLVTLLNMAVKSSKHAVRYLCKVSSVDINNIDITQVKDADVMSCCIALGYKATQRAALEFIKTSRDVDTYMVIAESAGIEHNVHYMKYFLDKHLRPLSLLVYLKKHKLMTKEVADYLLEKRYLLHMHLSKEYEW